MGTTNISWSKLRATSFAYATSFGHTTALKCTNVYKFNNGYGLQYLVSIAAPEDVLATG